MPSRGGVAFISTPAFFILGARRRHRPADRHPGLLPDRRRRHGSSLGYITSSSPPIVVNETIVVGNSAEQGYNQTPVENVPGDILAYDVATGDFAEVPGDPAARRGRPRDLENEASESQGNVSSWAPMTTNPELALVYVVTNGATIDYYGGHHPGNSLFSTSVMALDADTRRAALALPVRVPGARLRRRRVLILFAIQSCQTIYPTHPTRLSNSRKSPLRAQSQTPDGIIAERSTAPTGAKMTDSEIVRRLTDARQQFSPSCKRPWIDHLMGDISSEPTTGSRPEARG